MLPKLSNALGTGALIITMLVAVRTQAQTSSSSWKLSSGPLWRQVGRVNFSPVTFPSTGFSSLTGTVTTSGLPAGIYDNGFVLPDTNGGPNTSNFGWDAGTPITVTPQESFTFTLTKTNTITTTTATDLLSIQQGADGGRLNGPGFFIKLESPYAWERGGWALSMELGYSWTGMSLSRLQAVFSGILRETSLSTTFTDVYGGNDFGVTPGTAYTGNPSSGPEIPQVPSSSSSNTVEVKRAIIVDSAYNRSFGLDLQALSIGPHLTYESPEGRFQAGFSTGLALNVAYWNATTTELLAARGGGGIRSWTHHSSGWRVLPGIYVETSMAARINARWRAFLAARYDWAQKLHGGSGPTEFSLDLSGWTLMSGLTYQY